MNFKEELLKAKVMGWPRYWAQCRFDKQMRPSDWAVYRQLLIAHSAEQRGKQLELFTD